LRTYDPIKHSLLNFSSFFTTPLSGWSPSFLLYFSVILHFPHLHHLSCNLILFLISFMSRDVFCFRPISRADHPPPPPLLFSFLFSHGLFWQTARALLARSRTFDVHEFPFCYSSKFSHLRCPLGRQCLLSTFFPLRVNNPQSTVLTFPSFRLFVSPVLL